MRYQIIIEDMDLEVAKEIYASAIGVAPREVFGREGMSWGPARHRYIGNGTVRLLPMTEEPVLPRRSPVAVPFCLVRSLDTAEIRTFGGYIGQGRFIAVDAADGKSDEELVADWECIDGHGSLVDWPREG